MTTDAGLNALYPFLYQDDDPAGPPVADLARLTRA